MIDKAKIKYYREIHGITQEELARRLGIGTSTLARKETGESEFKRNEILKIKEILNLPEEEILNIFFS